jgi:hypothetical protein
MVGDSSLNFDPDLPYWMSDLSSHRPPNLLNRGRNTLKQAVVHNIMVSRWTKMSSSSTGFG